MVATTIEQSNKLIKLGVNPSTADMWWVGENLVAKIADFEKPDDYEAENIIPAWSLSALMDMVPEGTLLSIYKHEGKYWFISNEPSVDHSELRRHECYDNMIDIILNEFISNV